MLNQCCHTRTAVNKLFNEIAPRYTQRPGGYTRLISWDVVQAIQLMLHALNGFSMKDQVTRVVESVLSELRPMIQRDGGNIELVKIENNIVYVKLLGA